MGISHNPSIVTEGLVLGLDPQSPRFYNYKGRSVAFDGTGDYLTTPSSSAFDFGTGSFTVECWIFRKASGFQAIVGTRTGNTAATIRWSLFVNTSNVLSCNIRDTSNNDIASINHQTTMILNTWNHCALVRDGTSFRLYLNGVQSTSGTTSSAAVANSSTVVRIGDFDGSIISDMNGYISNLRILKGTALYTANFTPPTEPLTAITNTTLLTCQGNTITDASSSAHSISVTGGAEANLGFPKSAFVFDGTDDYVQVPNSSALQLGTGDFTIEMWWYMIGSGNCRGFTLGDAYDANGMELYLGSSGTSLNVYIENATRITADSVPSFDTWHHYVIERTIGTMKLYIDGVVQSGTYSSSQSLGTGTDGDLRLGVEYYNGGLSFVGDCKISNFKIYKGKGFTATEVTQNYNALKGRYA